jgi:prophage regulatory protein
MRHAQDEIPLHDAFCRMTPAWQDHCIAAARGLAQAFPRERTTPALRVVRQHEIKWECSMSESKKFLRLPAVLERVGLKRATIYKRIAAGTFPAPIQIGPRAVAWDEAALAAWQASLETGVKKALV